MVATFTCEHCRTTDNGMKLLKDVGDHVEALVHDDVEVRELFSFDGWNPIISLAFHDVCGPVLMEYMGTSGAMLLAQTCLFAVPLT